MELAAVFTRRDPSSVRPLTEGVAVHSADDLAAHAGDIDVLVLCGGSASDLPEQTPACASLFNVVDSFDTHAKIPEHFANVDAAAREGGKVAVISSRVGSGHVLARASVRHEHPARTAPITRSGARGVSQGHSDAIRRVEGVADARQYTVPVPAALEAVRAGETPELTTRQKHTRECYVVAKEGADRAAIERGPSWRCRTTSPTTTPR